MKKNPFALKRFKHAANRAITLQHHERPYVAQNKRISKSSYRKVSQHYLIDVRTSLGLKKSVLVSANEPFKPSLALEGSRVRFVSSKTIRNTRVVTYQHSYLGLPVWREGINVRMFADRQDIVSSSSTMTGIVRLSYLKLNEKQIDDPKNKKIITSLKSSITKTNRAMPARLRAMAKKHHSKSLEIVKQHTVIFRFDQSMREDPDHAAHKNGQHGVFLKLDEVPDSIKDDSYRVCEEVFFSLHMPAYNTVNWRAVIDVKTGAILYLRANLHAIEGQVFPLDPERLSGDATLTPSSPATDLNPLRESETLQGLTAPAAGDPQALSGEFIEIQNLFDPPILPPTEAVGDDFDYDADTDDFAAVNAYYHMDSLFRMVDDFGLDTVNYFAGTTFPIPVDHRGLNGAENAFHSGTDALGRTDNFAFGLLSGGTVGYAILRAACAHEFAHSCLQNNINDGVFSWCHGFGDALGVVLCDAESLATDRFVRSPFMTSGAGLRRHDRDVAAGYAWGGTLDAAGTLSRRQILSTTMFRAYRSTGGDSEHSNPTVQLDRRSFASRYMSFLMLGAVGTMTDTAPPASAVDFETAVMDFDITNPDFEGHPGGAFHKVIRWAFEKQGLHKLPGDPADGEGAPPPVDVYIDDGRNGEYEYERNFWNTTDIWSAQVNDSTVGHQTPLVGVTNYFFIKVKNRGQLTAENVIVKAYQCQPGTGLVWPSDWTAMDTPEIFVGTLAAGAEITVGPFEWTPATVGHECILASVSADDDESNADTVIGDIPHWRLVPFDNNIAQRNVSPEMPDADALLESLNKRSFRANNPYNVAVTMVLEPELPVFLQKRDWRVEFNTPGGNRVKLPPRGSQKITFTLKPGKRFKKSDVPKKGANIDIVTTINNHVVGGMTYLIDPGLKKRLPELPTGDEKCIQIAQKLIECLGVRDKKVKGLRLDGERIELKL